MGQRGAGRRRRQRGRERKATRFVRALNLITGIVPVNMRGRPIYIVLTLYFHPLAVVPFAASPSCLRVLPYTYRTPPCLSSLRVHGMLEGRAYPEASQH